MFQGLRPRGRFRSQYNKPAVAFMGVLVSFILTADISWKLSAAWLCHSTVRDADLSQNSIVFYVLSRHLHLFCVQQASIIFAVFLKTFTSAIVFLGLSSSISVQGSLRHSGGKYCWCAAHLEVWFASGLRNILALNWWFKIHRLLL